MQKRKLTLSDAIDQWESTKRAIDGLKPLLDEAATVLIAHAERTGRRAYKDRIAVSATGGNLVLDQAKVKDFLGPRLPEFQTRSKPGWSLKLLK